MVLAFPFISAIQRQLLMSHHIPNSVLQKILTELRSVVIEMHPPALVGVSVAIYCFIFILTFYKVLWWQVWKWYSRISHCKPNVIGAKWINHSWNVIVWPLCVTVFTGTSMKGEVNEKVKLSLKLLILKGTYLSSKLWITLSGWLKQVPHWWSTLPNWYPLHSF